MEDYLGLIEHHEIKLTSLAKTTKAIYVFKNKNLKKG
jgi:hypothetical protein